MTCSEADTAATNVRILESFIEKDGIEIKIYRDHSVYKGSLLEMT